MGSEISVIWSQKSGAVFDRAGGEDGSFLGEVILAYGAQGALKIVGDILPLGAGSNAALGVAQLLIIFPTADITDMLHNLFLHLKWCVFYL